MARNEQLERAAEVFVGRWRVTMANLWWLEDPGAVETATAVGEWIDDSFVRLRAEKEGEEVWDFVIGGSDARDRLAVLYHDERGVLRVFDLRLDDDGSWAMTRADPDFHQRLVGRVEGDRMVGSADASEDEGATWRTDFDLTWERTG